MGGIVKSIGRALGRAGKSIGRMIKKIAPVLLLAAAVYMGRSLEERELNQLQSPVIYKRISGAYARAAKMKGVHPNVLQAQTWLQWRIDKGVARKVGVRT